VFIALKSDPQEKGEEDGREGSLSFVKIKSEEILHCFSENFNLHCNPYISDLY
jgi:hypothetical protein